CRRSPQPCRALQLTHRRGIFVKNPRRNPAIAPSDAVNSKPAAISRLTPKLRSRISPAGAVGGEVADRVAELAQALAHLLDRRHLARLGPGFQLGLTEVGLRVTGRLQRRLRI